MLSSIYKKWRNMVRSFRADLPIIQYVRFMIEQLVGIDTHIFRIVAQGHLEFPTETNDVYYCNSSYIFTYFLVLLLSLVIVSSGHYSSSHSHQSIWRLTSNCKGNEDTHVWDSVFCIDLKLAFQLQYWYTTIYYLPWVLLYYIVYTHIDAKITVSNPDRRRK